MNTNFESLVNILARKRPRQSGDGSPVLLFDNHRVTLQAGELAEIHWVDIMIELPNCRADSLAASTKLLQANREMAAATPIPSWFASGDKGEVFFINRLDWQEISAEALDQHIMDCVEQMTAALAEMMGQH